MGDGQIFMAFWQRECYRTTRMNGEFTGLSGRLSCAAWEWRGWLRLANSEELSSLGS
jgi:hypothetical protein